jgi:trehalose-phosphatase
MKYAPACLSEIKSKIEDFNRAALLLDFDGTLSPIVAKPKDARISEKNRRLLKKINGLWPVAIVTGRSLEVIIKKIGVGAFSYAASHGFEWNFDGKFKRRPIPAGILRKLEKFRRIIKKINKDYPPLIIEPKPYAVTFHYHLMTTEQKKRFGDWLNVFLAPIYKETSIRILWDKETVDIVPDLNWNKGEIVKLALAHFRGKNNSSLLPIYIGNGLTDEDAFKALKTGITIRVGKSKISAAKYYFRNREQVDVFLKWLSDIADKQIQSSDIFCHK